MTVRRKTPDGRAIVVGWISFRDAWRVRFDDDRRLFEGRRLRDAVADATGEPADSAWILDLERELAPQAGYEREAAAR